MKTIYKEDIVQGLTELGLKQGDVVIVHTSLKSIGYVCGGAQAVIEALIEVATSEGTIVMPTQSWKNLDPEQVCTGMQRSQTGIKLERIGQHMINR